MAKLFNTSEVLELLDEEMDAIEEEPCLEGSGDELDLDISDEEERLVAIINIHQ